MERRRLCPHRVRRLCRQRRRLLSSVPRCAFRDCSRRPVGDAIAATISPTLRTAKRLQKAHDPRGNPLSLDGEWNEDGFARTACDAFAAKGDVFYLQFHGAHSATVAVALWATQLRRRFLPRFAQRSGYRKRTIRAVIRSPSMVNGTKTALPAPRATPLPPKATSSIFSSTVRIPRL